MFDNAWYGHHAEHRRAALKGWRRRKKSRKVKAAAGRPRKKKVGRPKKKKMTVLRSTRTYPVAGVYGYPNPRRRKRARRMDNPRRKRRARRMDNPRRRARRAVRHDNPMVSYNAPRRRGRGRFRRNPVGSGIMAQTMNALPHVGVGAVSVITTALVPKFTAKVSSSHWASLGGQIAWVFGGGYVVNKFTKNKYGLAWMVGGGSVILADLVHKYVLGGVLAGLGVYEPALGAYESLGATSPLGAVNPGFAPPQMIGYRDTTGMSLAPEYVAGVGDFGLADAEYRG